MKLKDRVALVTGGSRGIGRAIVESLAREGAKVAFVYNSNADAANAVVAALDGCDVDAYQADVRDKQAADKVVEQVIEKWGKIDILVNNAGIIRDGLLATMDVDQSLRNHVIRAHALECGGPDHAVAQLDRAGASRAKGSVFVMI